jgi:pilus assembly protein CpaB
LARDGKPIPSTVVTLLVTPEDSERIVLAQSEGQIMLTLRNPMDVAPTQTAGVRTPALIGVAPAPPPPAQAPVVRRPPRVAAAPVAAPPPVPRVYTIETFKGMKRTEAVISGPYK